MTINEYIENDYYLDLLDIISESNQGRTANHIDNLRTEFIRLKAIEQAAKDFASQIVYSSEPNSKSAKDLEYLKELLQIN